MSKGVSKYIFTYTVTSPCIGEIFSDLYASLIHSSKTSLSVCINCRKPRFSLLKNSRVVTPEDSGCCFQKALKTTNVLFQNRASYLPFPSCHHLKECFSFVDIHIYINCIGSALWHMLQWELSALLLIHRCDQVINT